MNQLDCVDHLVELFVGDGYFEILERLISVTTNTEESFFSLKMQAILLARFKSLFMDETLEERCLVLLLQFLNNIILCTEHLDINMEELNMLPTFMTPCYTPSVRFWTCRVMKHIFFVRIKQKKDILNAEWLDAVYMNIYEIGYEKDVSLEAAYTFLSVLKGTKKTLQLISDNQYETPLLYAFESIAFDHCTKDEHTYELPYILLESLECLVNFYRDEELHDRQKGIVYWVTEVLKTIHPIQDSRIRAIAQRFNCWNSIDV
jgi:hypothetical protein